MSQIAIRAALENALKALGETLPSFSIASSSAGSPCVFTSVAPHRLKSGVNIKIEGHSNSTPDLNGGYLAVEIDATRFSLMHRVTKAPIASSAAGIAGVCTPQLTAWDNLGFAPVPSVPYQKVNLAFAEPDNPTMGSGFTREHGFMQVSLFYPTQMGTFDINSRVELIRSAFPRGATFTKDGIVVHIPRTANVMQGMPIDESYAIPVRIPFYADVYN